MPWSVQEQVYKDIKSKQTIANLMFYAINLNYFLIINFRATPNLVRVFVHDRSLHKKCLAVFFSRPHFI